MTAMAMLDRCPDRFEERVIHGDRFAAIADVEINQSATGPRVARGAGRLGRGARLVFVKTDFVPDVFAALCRIPHPDPFLLITHNSDRPVTRRLFESAPPCVAGWFALNVDHQSPGLVPIPSGMERPGGGGHSADYTRVRAAWRAGGDADRPHLVFACWNPRTNVVERERARRAFEGRPSVAWRQPSLSHEEFLRLCRDARFVISPPGHGIDCHRTWEAMYMGAIPIVAPSSHVRGFPDLPLVVAADWNALTDDALAGIHEAYRQRAWHLDQLFFDYWEDRIRREAAALARSD